MTHVERILVIAAHPDDEILGCGGTMPFLARAGHEVFIAILGEGITSRGDRRESAEPRELDDLHKNAHEAAALMGAKKLFLEKLPDNRFDSLPLLEVVKVVEKLIGNVRPTIVYTHHGGDLNIDHAVVHRAVLTATRPQNDMPVKEIYAFEVPSSTEWAFQQMSPSFRPNVFQDIGLTLELKIQAMNTYKSEIRQFPHPRSAQALQAIGRRWGTVVGCEAAEAFELIRSIRMKGCKQQ